MTDAARTSAKRFSDDNPSIRLWNSLEPTDPAFLKEIKGKTYKGHSPVPAYVIKRLTAAFGPVGWGWGYEIEHREDVVTGDRVTNFVTIRFWYFPFGRPDSQEIDPRRIPGYASFPQEGGTAFAYTSGKGNHTVDDDARKKSLTDAVTKAASLIGVVGDLFLGRIDDSKYLAERVEEEETAAAIAVSRFAFCLAGGRQERKFLDAKKWHEFWSDHIRVAVEKGGQEGLPALRDANRANFEDVAKVAPRAVAAVEKLLQDAISPPAEAPAPTGDHALGDHQAAPPAPGGGEALVAGAATAKLPRDGAALLKGWLGVSPAIPRGTEPWVRVVEAVEIGLHNSLGDFAGLAFKTALRMATPAEAGKMRTLVKGKWKDRIEDFQKLHPDASVLLETHVTRELERAERAAPAEAA